MNKEYSSKFGIENIYGRDTSNLSRKCACSIWRFYLKKRPGSRKSLVMTTMIAYIDEIWIWILFKERNKSVQGIRFKSHRLFATTTFDISGNDFCSVILFFCNLIYYYRVYHRYLSVLIGVWLSTSFKYELISMEIWLLHMVTSEAASTAMVLLWRNHMARITRFQLGFSKISPVDILINNNIDTRPH